jgi:hypothetical protein
MPQFRYVRKNRAAASSRSRRNVLVSHYGEADIVVGDDEQSQAWTLSLTEGVKSRIVYSISNSDFRKLHKLRSKSKPLFSLTRARLRDAPHAICTQRALVYTDLVE